MKKTLTINISGIIFHIDEDAFELLSNYLTKLKKHFSPEAGSEEIIADIESRLAELLQQRISRTKQVIIRADIEEVVAQLGDPIEMEENAQAESHEAGADKQQAQRRLFRDPDNRAIAGVAAGLSAYFGIDAMWVRLLFLLLLFASGAGILIYVILWVALPEAVTTAEKLQMQGKPVNIETIENSIRKEFEVVKERIDHYADEARSSYEKQKHHIRQGTQSAMDVLVRIFMLGMRVIGIFIGALLLFISVVLIFALGAIFLGWDSLSLFEGSHIVHNSLSGVYDWFFASPLSVSLTPVLLSLFIGIPLILLVYVSLRLIIGAHFRIPGFGKNMGLVWLGSLIGLGLVASDTFADFRHKAIHHQSTHTIDAKHHPVLYVSSKPHQHNKDLPEIHLFNTRYYMEDRPQGKKFNAVPMLSIRSTAEANASLTISSFAAGHSLEEATRRAEHIEYQIQLKDSLLSLSPYFSFWAADKLRQQEVQITLKVPEGQLVYFDANMEQFLNNNPHRHWGGLDVAGNYWAVTPSGLQPGRQP